MLELSEQDPKGPVADPAVDDGKKFLEDLAAKEKAEAEEAMRKKTIEAAKANSAKHSKKPLYESSEPEKPKEEPKIAPDYPVGKVFGRLGQYGGDRIVLDKDKFYRFCVRIVRTDPRMATAYVRMIGELMGIDNFYEAQAKWQEINHYHEKRS